MRLIRLAYAAQFLMALVTVFVLWSEVGGQSHLDLMPWYLAKKVGTVLGHCVVAQLRKHHFRPAHGTPPRGSFGARDEMQHSNDDEDLCAAARDGR